MVNIRKIDKNDAQEINLLGVQLGYTQTIEQTQAQIESLAESPNDFIYLYQKNNITVAWIHGFIAIRLESCPFAEIGGLVVDEKYRAQGIGTQLISAFIAWSKSKGIDKIRVRTNAKRLASHGFYENIGFVKNKEQKVFDKAI